MVYVRICILGEEIENDEQVRRTGRWQREATTKLLELATITRFAGTIRDFSRRADMNELGECFQEIISPLDALQSGTFSDNFCVTWGFAFVGYSR